MCLSRLSPPADQGGSRVWAGDTPLPAQTPGIPEHERHHVCNLDPLKVVLVQALSSAFFFLPALDSLRARYLGAESWQPPRFGRPWSRRCARSASTSPGAAEEADA